MKLPILLDANVLYGYTLRDTFMHLAANRVIEVRWTNQIHEEWIAALLENRADLTRESLLKVRDLMNLHAVDSLVTGYESLIEKLDLPDPDRSPRFGGCDLQRLPNPDNFERQRFSASHTRTAQH